MVVVPRKQIFFPTLVGFGDYTKGFAYKIIKLRSQNLLYSLSRICVPPQCPGLSFYQYTMSFILSPDAQSSVSEILILDFYWSVPRDSQLSLHSLLSAHAHRQM